MINGKRPYLSATGYLQSKTSGKPVDASGQPIPWMNYAIVDFLKERLNGSQTMFEYGSGYSTHFFAERVHSLTSVEYDKHWMEFVKKNTESFTNV